MYESKLKNDDTDELFRAVLALKDEEECYRFFEDLCTINEIKSLSQRYSVARLLKNGFKFTDVAEKTGASSATISRVKRCIDYGANGYNTLIDRLKSK